MTEANDGKGELRRFFIKEIEARDGFCRITGSEARHITKALRMGRGDRIILMDGKGGRFLAIVESTGGQEVLVALERSLPQPPPSPVEITLCQALLKSHSMDMVVEKTSELGVCRIFPFSSARTVVRLDERRFAHKARRWREIGHCATKQSDRRTPPEIGPLLLFGDLVARWQKEKALKVIFWEEEGEKHLKGLLRASFPVKKVIGIVGPEGGFTREEIWTARGAGFTSISLGQRVLRAETAAITTVAIVQYEWGDLTLNNL